MSRLTFTLVAALGTFAVIAGLAGAGLDSWTSAAAGGVLLGLAGADALR